MMSQATLDERVRSVAGKVPGVLLLVIGPEGVRARSAVGFADLVTHLPMATDIAIPWFSITKTATATTAVRLAERGLFELDSPVLPLVPTMRSLQPAHWAESITVRHLLQHSAGLANPMPVKWIHRADKRGPDPDAFLEELLAKHAKLRFEPGSRSSYSNVGPLILGAAMARLAGRGFEAVVRDEILGPLDMSSTGFVFGRVCRRPPAITRASVRCDFFCLGGSQANLRVGGWGCGASLWTVLLTAGSSEPPKILLGSCGRTFAEESSMGLA